MDNHLTLFVPGPLPGMNEIVAARSRFSGKAGARGKKWNAYSALKQDWHTVIAACVKRDLPGVAAIDFKVYLSFLWREKTQRRDLDNIAAGKKFVIDGLVQSGILRGDGWRHVGGFDDGFEVNAIKPGVLVTITRHVE